MLPASNVEIASYREREREREKGWEGGERERESERERQSIENLICSRGYKLGPHETL